MAECQARFHELAWYATKILATKYERIRCFVRGLNLPLRKATQNFVNLRKSFTEIANHIHTIEEMNYEAQGGGDKKLRQQGSYVGATIAHSSGVEVFIVGTLSTSLISTRSV